MKLTSLHLSSFRNYPSFSLEPIGDLNIFVGPNGVGKTNILEAVQLMTSASSFRNPQVSQLILEGRESGRISAELSDGNRQLQLELLLEPGKKKYRLNGKPKGIADVRGTLPAVSFTPDDLQLAKKSSSVKRDALDNLGVQLARNYYIVRRDYEKTVRYKNRLLKEEATRPLVESINETLVTCGSQLFCYRHALFTKLLPLVKENYAAILGEEAHERPDEGFSAIYRPSWEVKGSNQLSYVYGSFETPVEQETPPSNAKVASSETCATRNPEGSQPDCQGGPVETKQAKPGKNESNPTRYERAQVKEFLIDSLNKSYEEERARKRSIIGPHNDKIEFTLAGRDVSNFASQGQQRSIVLAWKLAEVELTRQTLGVNPVLLLDDVMSELDSTRRDMLVQFVTDDIQTFITATDLSPFNETLLTRAQIHNV